MKLEFDKLSQKLNDSLIELETHNEILDKEEIVENISKVNSIIDEYKKSIESVENIQLDNEILTRYKIDINNKIILLSEKISISTIDNRNFLLRYLEKNINDIIKEIKIFRILTNLIYQGSNTLIIGANGSGKSSLANFFKRSIFYKIKVIPAIKYLYFQSELSESNQLTMRTYNEEFEKSYIKLDGVRENRFRYDKTEEFTKLVSAISNEYFNNKVLEEFDDISVFDFDYNQFSNIWKSFFPNISIRPDASTHGFKICNVDRNTEYDINMMSDGERAAIYYIGNVLLAEENSIILIDEPETYLNDNISVKIWNKLCEYRNDCKFIFITHNINFISTINNVDIIWCKNYEFPDYWDLERINKTEIPRELFVKIATSKKPVIYCEGSKDKRIYESIFYDKYTIIPVSGSYNVKKSVRLHKINPQLKETNCYGIIDRDQGYHEKEEGIIILKHNEIEMLLLDDLVMRHVLKKLMIPNYEEKIDLFKAKFLNKIAQRKDAIISNTIKAKYDYYFYKERIQQTKGNTNELKKDIISLINKAFNYDCVGLITEDKLKETIDEEIKSLNIKIDEIISTKNYEQALEICNLKDNIFDQFGEILCKDYKNLAIYQLSDDNLRKNIITKYFPELEELKEGQDDKNY